MNEWVNYANIYRIRGGMPLSPSSNFKSRQLSYEYKSRRKAFNALANLDSAFPPENKLLENVDVFVTTDDVVLVCITLSPQVTDTDVAKAEGVFSGGKPTTKKIADLDSRLRSFKEIYLNAGWKMFRAFGWQKGQNER